MTLVKIKATKRIIDAVKDNYDLDITINTDFIRYILPRSWEGKTRHGIYGVMGNGDALYVADDTLQQIKKIKIKEDYK